MKKYLIKFSLIVTALLLTGCSVPFSGQKTQLRIENDESEIEVNNTQEEAGEEVNIPERLPETNIEESKEIETNSNANVNSEEPKKGESTKEDKSDFSIKNKLVSWGFSKADNRKIDTIIIHSSYNAVGSDPHDLDDIIYKEYKPYGVSPHYIISREGKVYRLVDDKNIAYHAGESKMPDGRTGVNNFSIGIEIVNTKSEKPSSSQYEALNSLIAYLKGKYKIKYVLGHSDIAPGRKDDPWNVDWNKIR